MTVEVLREAVRLAERGERVGLATLVGTRGSTPQKVGARLLARDGQRLAGTLGGGAVEAEAVREAAQAAVGGARGLREYVLSTGVDDWGLACGGTMVVFVEPLDASALAWLRPVIEATDGREPVAVVTALDGPVSGARVVVREGGVTGSVSDPAFLTAAATDLGTARAGAGGARAERGRPARSSTPSPSALRRRWSSSGPATWERRWRVSRGSSASP